MSGAYRVAYWTDGRGELPLTLPEEAEFSDEELLERARALAAELALDMQRGEIRVGLWRE